MNAAQVRAELAVVARLRSEAGRIETNALTRFEAPKPGAVVRRVSDGKIMVVKDQGGVTMLDTMGNRGLIEASFEDLIGCDILQDGAE